MIQRRSHGSEDVQTSKAGVTVAELQSVHAGASDTTYEQYYGLTTRPFGVAAVPDTWYRSPTHASAVASLNAALRRGERLMALTGEPGTGKTTVCRVVLNALGRETCTSVVPDPFLSREDLLRSLLVDFGHVSVEALGRGHLSEASRLELCYQLRGFLAALEPAASRAVLVIEEAQYLAPPLLDEIRALSELEVGRTPLQIVLVGQRELRSHLAQPRMRQIEQRVTTRCELRPLTSEELADYVAHRLAMAGGSPARVAFAQSAIDVIHAASNGVPRLVNLICDRAMSRGHLERTSVIGPPIVAYALDELQLTPAPAADRVQPSAPVSKVSEPAEPSMHEARSHRGLFEKKPVGERAAFDFNALLALPATSPGLHAESAMSADAEALSAFPRERTVVRSPGSRNRWSPLKAAGLVLGGMIMMSILGGFIR